VKTVSWPDLEVVDAEVEVGDALAVHHDLLLGTVQARPQLTDLLIQTRVHLEENRKPYKRKGGWFREKVMNYFKNECEIY
jgi:hypothetical protein